MRTIIERERIDLRRRIEQVMQNRQQKRRGFARAGLGGGNQITAGKHDRYRLRLHRRRFLIAHFARGLHQ